MAVLMQGTTGEAERSLASGAAVATALEARGHAVSRVTLSDTGRVLSELATLDVDAAFLALHGRSGMCGAVQGVLELLRVPYTGSALLTNALALDRLKSREIFRLHNLRTLACYSLARTEEADLEELHGSFGYPVRVEARQAPAGTRAHEAQNLGHLTSAVRRAFERADLDELLIERCVKGRAIGVAVLDRRVLGAGERTESGYSVLTGSGSGGDFSAERLRGVLNMAERAASALGTSGAAEVHVLVTDAENEYLIGIDCLPALGPSSLVGAVAAEVGFGFPELCEAVLSRARLHSLEGCQGGRATSLAPNVAAEIDAVAAVAAVQRRASTRARGAPDLPGAKVTGRYRRSA